MRIRQGIFFTADNQRSKAFNTFDIRLRVEDSFAEPRIVTDGSVIVAGFALEEERDRYFDAWTDDEIMSLYKLTHQLWEAPATPQGRARLSRALEQLKDRVQKRAKIKNT